MEKEYSTEKLLDLLSEYMEEIKGRDVEITSVGWEKYEGEIRKFIVEYIDEYNDEEEKSYIGVGKLISKKFGFIKWLVENEKIDRVEVWSEGKTKPTYGYTTEPYTTCKSIELENTILMVLAIQDEPINFLISILK